ncbi:hypothetical protein SESBI_48226 [Sesbania bispinosa]|nr:hypothetical protein SESBI_48226 [Sesbania bispinosa]
MNVEVLCPNHRQVIEDVEPPGDASSPDSTARQSDNGDGHEMLEVRDDAATRDVDAGKEQDKPLGTFNANAHHSSVMEMG